MLWASERGKTRGTSRSWAGTGCCGEGALSVLCPSPGFPGGPGPPCLQLQSGGEAWQSRLLLLHLPPTVLIRFRTA